MLLEKKNAVIYGAGGAVGGAVARAFAREGAKVFLAGRTVPKLDLVAHEIAAAGGAAETARVDALDDRAVTAHVDGVATRAGGIDILFNAVGWDDVQGATLAEMKYEDFIQPIAIAMRSQFLVATAVAHRMLERRSGVILAITATPARMAFPQSGGFGVAGAAVEGLCRGLAAELGPHGIRVVCLRSAGSPDAPSYRRAAGEHAKAVGETFETFQAMLEKQTMLHRMPMLAEVANAAVFMASDRASAITGAVANLTCGAIAD
jgi:3-oxoacyl-[acyl-carrier protein] reductase